MVCRRHRSHLVPIDRIEMMESLDFIRNLTRTILITPVVEEALEHGEWTHLLLLTEATEYWK